MQSLQKNGLEVLDVVPYLEEVECAGHLFICQEPEIRIEMEMDSRS